MKKFKYIIISLLLVFSLKLSANPSYSIASPLPNCSAQFSDSADANNSLLIHFTDLSTGNITNRAWDFGDGNTSSMQNPNHTYSQAGNFTVSLHVSNTSSGCNDSIIKTITVYANPNPCQAAYNYSVSPSNNHNYSFTDQSQGFPYQWQWDFGDGNNSNIQNPNHTYNQAGNYTVWLKITTQSCVDSVSQQITVAANTNTGSLLVYAYADTNYLNNGKVYLYHHDNNNQFSIYDSSYATNSQGVTYYNFPNIPIGYYFVYAKANSSQSSIYYDTWMPNTIYSQAADSILVNSNTIYTSIQMAKSSVSYPMGNGSIKGTIKTKANGANLPLGAVSIYLMLNDSNIISKTLSNQQGEYEFASLAFGTYYIHPEIIGKSTQNKKVVLDFENPEEDSASFVVDGKNIIAGISSTNNLESNIYIYPNPAKETLNIRSELKKGIDLKIQILNIQGQVVYDQTSYFYANGQVKINVSNLSNGLYFIYIQSHNTQVVKKFIKH